MVPKMESSAFPRAGYWTSSPLAFTFATALTLATTFAFATPFRTLSPPVVKTFKVMTSFGSCQAAYPVSFSSTKVFTLGVKHFLFADQVHVGCYRLLTSKACIVWKIITIV